MAVLPYLNLSGVSPQKRHMKSARLSLNAFLGAAVLACAGDNNAPTAPRLAASDPLLVRNVIPASGATNVDPRAPITIAFSSGMMTAMEKLVVLHEGAVTGPAVPGTATWSTDRRTLTFTPVNPLESNMVYVLHLSPNLMDAKGDTVSFAACATALGGTPVPASLMKGSGGMMGGGSGMMGGTNGMMGSGWQPGSGTWGYGMALSFKTA
jgi:hypothetical protein